MAMRCGYEMRKLVKRKMVEMTDELEASDMESWSNVSSGSNGGVFQVGVYLDMLRWGGSRVHRGASHDVETGSIATVLHVRRVMQLHGLAGIYICVFECNFVCAHALSCVRREPVAGAS